MHTIIEIMLKYEPLLSKAMTVQLRMMQILCHDISSILSWLGKYLIKDTQVTCCANSKAGLYLLQVKNNLRTVHYRFFSNANLTVGCYIVHVTLNL